jgi:hypothetical protein
MPQQATYISLPNGSYVQIPPNATPEQLSAFKDRLASFSKASGMTKEQQAVEQAPNPVKQAQENVRRPLDQLHEKAFSIFTPTGDVPPEQLQKTRDVQRQVTETVGAMLGGEAVVPLTESAEAAKALRETHGLGHWLLPKVMRAAGAGAGAAAGSAVSGEKPTEAIKTGGQYAGMELGGEAALSALNAAYLKIFSDPKLSMQQASKLLADTMSKEELSPRQFGASLQDSFDHIKNTAGQAKGEFVTRVAREHPDVTVDYGKTQDVLKTWVNNLNFMKSHNPSLFAQGEGMTKTLNILTDELNSTNGEIAGIKSGMKKGNFAEADLRRSQFWNYKQQLDPSMASRIVGDLDKASTDDIAKALAGKDPKLAQEYLSASARYKELSSLGRMETLKNVFGNERVAPGNVIEVLNQAPEDSLAAVRTMNRDNPAAVQNLRRSLFEQSLKTAGQRGLFKLQPALVREIYGPQADSVSKFIDVVNSKAGGGSLLTKLPGKYGAAFRLAEGINRPGITIRASEMAKILKSSEMTRLFTQAAEMPAKAGPSNMMRETLDRAIQAAGVQVEEAAPKGRRPIWAEERRASASRRQTEGASPTGVERRSLKDISGPDPMRASLMRNMQSEIDKLPKGHPEREVLQNRLDDMKAHPFDEPAGGRDFLREGRAGTERRMTRAEAEAETERRKAGRRQRFGEE